jgi:hypothetical protein
VVRDDEGGGLFPIRVALSEIDHKHLFVVDLLAKYRVLAVSTVRPSTPSAQGGSEQVLALATLRPWWTLTAAFAAFPLWCAMKARPTPRLL